MKSLSSSIEPLEARIAPATFVVFNLDDSGGGSLRDALAMADAHSGADTIVFKLPAPPAHSENIIQLTSGSLMSKGNVNIIGPGAGRLIIDGNSVGSVFTFNDALDTDSPVTMSGLSIVHGRGTNLGGGGIVSGESLTLKGMVVSDNSATLLGGGILVVGTDTSGTKVSISNSLISRNSAVDSAGVILEDVKSATITGTVITGNTATGGVGGLGISISATGTGATIMGSVISGNTAATSGGLAVGDGNPAASSKISIISTKITGNTSTDTNTIDGGGGLSIGAGHTVITGSTIENNSASSGGGILAKDFTSLTISSSTISGNQSTGTSNGTAYEGGGGIYINGGGKGAQSVTISGSKITDNRSAAEGGGIFEVGDGATTGSIALTIAGCIVAGNQAAKNGGGLCALSHGSTTVGLTVTSGVFSDNSGAFGGGIFVIGGDTGQGISPAAAVTIAGTKITGNIAANSGGGIDGLAPFGELTIKNAIVTGNTANANGGGLYIKEAGGFKVTGGSFTANSAATGGGIEAYSSSGSILGVTISGNSAGRLFGGGVANLGATPGAITLTIAKVFANTAATDPDVFDPSDMITFV